MRALPLGRRRLREEALPDEVRRRLAERRAAATGLVGSAAAAGYVAGAPAGYLLAHGPADVARQARLLAGPGGSPRVVVTPSRSPREWRIDVAGRDRPGLLAAISGVLAAQRLDVVRAVAATWEDGSALDAFVVRSDAAPDSLAIEEAVAANLRVPQWSAPITGATVAFEREDGRPYTLCTVVASDRPGLLHDLAVAITSAGADIHAASLSSDRGVAR
ncbi:MAG TPA: hypothetical protein VFH45_10760, partial [Acidimicrobiales bacterium]|nr:hypothetical protein [Acidimicrobiales bacterium]